MNNEQKKDRLKTQITLREDLLKRWLSEGVPQGVAVPKSLNLVRLWEDRSLGIESIKSPSSFTSTHPEHGLQILRIAKSLEKLLSVRRKKTIKRTSDSQSRQEIKALENALAATSNQIVELRAELAETKRYLKMSEDKSKRQETKIKELEHELHALKVVASDKIKIGNVRKVDFKGSKDDK